MFQSPSFLDLLKQAFHLPFERPRLWLYGGMMAATFEVQDAALRTFGIASGTTDHIDALFNNPSGTQASSFGLLIFVSFGISLFGKSNLIPALADRISPDKTTNRLPESQKHSGRGDNFRRGLIIEGSFILFLVVLLSLLALPATLSLAVKPVAFPSLVIFGLLILFPVLAVAFCIKEFALFYSLLARLKARASFEASVHLVVLRARPLIRFGALSLLLIMSFSSLYGAASSALALPFRIVHPLVLAHVLPILVRLVILSWWNIFFVGWWYLFFVNIARSDAEQNTGSVTDSAYVRQSAPDFPPA